MNTKSFRRQHLHHFLAVALIAAVLAASLRQSYAPVGYVNVPIRQGLNLIANPLDSDGTGTNNNANVFLGADAPEGTCFYRFDPSTQNYMAAATYLTGFGWCPVSMDTNDPALKVNTGEAFWIESPQGNRTITFVGQVLEGNLTNALPANYSLKADMIPLGGNLQADLKFPPRSFDRVWKWTGAAFEPYSFDAAWAPMEPSLAVAEGFILERDPAQATQANWWVQTFFVPRVTTASRPIGGSGAPELRNIKLEDGDVVLEVASSTSSSYDVQFSSDGFSWTTVARGVKGNKWKARFPGGNRGYYQLAKP